MKPFSLEFTAFSLCWLRSYDFGLRQDALKHAVELLPSDSVVKHVSRIADPVEVDEIDKDLFDVRYQDRSKLVRIQLSPFELVNQKLGGRIITTSIMVSLLLDIESGFGVFDLCLSQPDAQNSAFTIEEISFLMRQWMLVQDESGKPLRLNISLPTQSHNSSLYIREVINWYFLQVHKLLWETVKPGCWPNPTDLCEASQEIDPRGCEYLRELYRQGLIRSFFPTSFGPFLDVWGMKGISPTNFEPGSFSKNYERELAWLLTDGRNENLGKDTASVEIAQGVSQALFVWPNHAIYINQNLESTSEEFRMRRCVRYGLIDVEIVRILEVLNLQSAMLHTFDRDLDRQLEQVSSIVTQDPQSVIRITEQLRGILRLIRIFDFFNLFHTTHWEPLYVRLLENPHLRFRQVVDLVESKTRYLDDEIRQAVIIQDRSQQIRDSIRQQQQQEQELRVLQGIHALNRGMHSLSLANDVQNNALMIINFVVSATAAFAFTEVLSPWLTSLSGAQPSFQDANPFVWILLNVGIYLFIAVFLFIASSLLIQRNRRIVEFVGQIDIPFNSEKLKFHLRQRQDLEYFHLNMDDNSGYLRIRKQQGVLLLEFSHNRFYRFALFLQGVKISNLESLIKSYLDSEMQRLRQAEVVI